MNGVEDYRWIRSDGQEIHFSDRREILAMILSGEIGQDDLVRITADGGWVRAAELRATLESALDAEASSRGSGYEEREPAPGWSREGSPGDQHPDPAWSAAEAPWRRYFARMFDFAVAGVALGIPLGILFPALFIDDSLDGVLTVLGVLVGFPVLDALFLSKWQTSPGKWLLSVRTVRPDGRRLTFGDALGRSYGVLIKGMWFGIPLLAIIPLLMAHSRASRGEPQPWERATGTRTEVRPFGVKLLLFLVLVGLFIVLLALDSVAQM